MNLLLKFLNSFAIGMLLGMIIGLFSLPASANDLTEVETMLEMFDEGEEVMTRCPAGKYTCEPDEVVVKKENIEGKKQLLFIPSPSP